MCIIDRCVIEKSQFTNFLVFAAAFRCHRRGRGGRFAGPRRWSGATGEQRLLATQLAPASVLQVWCSAGQLLPATCLRTGAIVQLRSVQQLCSSIAKCFIGWPISGCRATPIQFVWTTSLTSLVQLWTTAQPAEPVVRTTAAGQEASSSSPIQQLWCSETRSAFAELWCPALF